MQSLTQQIGGDHYKKMKMQPFEFTMRNGWDSCAHSILKYVSRFDTKGGIEDLRKAIHICEIREDLLPSTCSAFGLITYKNGIPAIAVREETAATAGFSPIRMLDYMEANDFTTEQRTALFELDRWVLSGAGSRAHPTINAIRLLMKANYGVSA